MKAGLVSVSFRGLSTDEVLSAAKACGLEGIEWGGDIHVPCGDLETARRVGEATRNAGIEVVCYGSYCKMTDAECSDLQLQALVETAKALGAPRIRIWAGSCGSADADDGYRAEIVRNTQRLADVAAEAGLDLAFEYHGKTLTDEDGSLLALLRAVDRKNVGTLWQPHILADTDGCVAGLRAVREHVRHFHVFSWTREIPPVRLPLAEGTEKWMRCLDEIETLPGERWLMMEFVQNDDTKQLAEDAACLIKWIEERKQK